MTNVAVNLSQDDLFQPPDQEACTWRDVLGKEKEKRYFSDLLAFVENERASGKVIFPRNDQVFAALSLTPFDQVKVVILGQDPYHGPNQAHGLCFSVQPGVPAPPSLENIFKELKEDVDFQRPTHGTLTGWAEQGVLLLNAVLTVQASNAGSHAGKGWERFTDRIIAELNDRREGIVFLLWGSYAQKKGSIIDPTRHTVLTAPHPSPLSAHRGFFGCRHFSKANEVLKSQGVAPIDWNATERATKG
jgi:uracil-DNA glycosylase